MSRSYRTLVVSGSVAGCALVLALVAPGCGDDSSGLAPEDTGADVQSDGDAVVDSTMDTGTDTAVEDTGVDDTGTPDTGTPPDSSDTGSPSDADAASDTAVAADADAATDTADSGPPPVCYATSWCVVATPATSALYDVWATADNNVWTVGAGGKVYRYDGSTWATLTTPIPATDVALTIWGSAANNVYVAAKSTIYRYDGTSWSTATTAAGGAIITDLDGTAANDVWAVGQKGTILHWNGTTWTSLGAPSTPDAGTADGGVPAVSLTAIRALGPNDAWVFASDGSIRRWDGSAWNSLSSPTTSSITKPALISATEIFAPLYAGGIIRWDGAAWAAASVPAGASGTGLYAGWGSSPTNVWVVGETGTILSGGKFGFTLVAPPTSGRPDLLSIYGVSSTSVWAVGTGGTVLHYKP